MYLLYLDESGSPGNVAEEYFVLAGVCVFERQVHWLAKELDDLAREFQPDNPDALELHATRIANRSGPPWRSMSRAECHQALGKVLDILGRAEKSTCLFACAVHKPSFESLDPVEMAFEHVCSRFDIHLKSMHQSGDTQRGMLVFDKTSYEQGLQQLSRQFRTLGTRWGVLRNLVDVPLFVDSKASRIVQLADHVAYATFRRYERGDIKLFEQLCPRFHQDQGKLHGLVHMYRGWRECYCPACLSRRQD